MKNNAKKVVIVESRRFDVIILRIDWNTCMCVVKLRIHVLKDFFFQWFDLV
jgi:hypothetical protein